MPDNEEAGRLIGPAATLVTYLAEAHKFAATTKRCLLLTKDMRQLVVLVQAKLPGLASASRPALRGLHDFIKDTEAFAREEVESSFATVARHHAIETWAAIECCIENVLSLLVEGSQFAELYEIVSTTRSRVDQKTLERAIARGPKYALSYWESGLSDASTMGRYCQMLGGMGLRVALTNETQKKLDELAEMRNVILHRGGTIDQRFIEKCPWRSETIGQSIRLTDADLIQHYDAAGKFAIALVAQASQFKRRSPPP